MSKEELIRQCRYYNGEKNNPHSDKYMSWFWDMERVYVSKNGNFVGETEIYHNLQGRKFTGIPFNLLMVMFTGWAKYTTDIAKELSDFYELIELYLDLVSDHFSKYTIPD
ncbi:MAG: hypothetical protein II670_03905 [Alphaproteobacteria bacterium]|nr:hypothetical protein [Alphaproteobacteria bacterium]